MTDRPSKLSTRYSMVYFQSYISNDSREISQMRQTDGYKELKSRDATILLCEVVRI